jgi:hypothetical protein
MCTADCGRHHIREGAKTRDSGAECFGRASFSDPPLRTSPEIRGRPVGGHNPRDTLIRCGKRAKTRIVLFPQFRGEEHPADIAFFSMWILLAEGRSN